MHRNSTMPSNNPNGRNQWSNCQFDNPYTLRFALAKFYLGLGLSYDEIHAKTMLSRQTICRIKKGEKEVSDELVEALKKVETKKLSLLSHEIFDSINEESISKASLLQRVTAGSILIDKRLLLDGKATMRIGFEDLTDEELGAKIEKDKELLRRLEAGEVIDVDLEEEPEESV